MTNWDSVGEAGTAFMGNHSLGNGSIPMGMAEDCTCDRAKINHRAWPHRMRGDVTEGSTAHPSSVTEYGEESSGRDFPVGRLMSPGNAHADDTAMRPFHKYSHTKARSISEFLPSWGYNS